MIGRGNDLGEVENGLSLGFVEAEEVYTLEKIIYEQSELLSILHIKLLI